MKELIRVRVQYASRQQCCKTHKQSLPLPFTSGLLYSLFQGLKLSEREAGLSLSSNASHFIVVFNYRDKFVFLCSYSKMEEKHRSRYEPVSCKYRSKCLVREGSTLVKYFEWSKVQVRARGPVTLTEVSVLPCRPSGQYKDYLRLGHDCILLHSFHFVCRCHHLAALRGLSGK